MKLIAEINSKIEHKRCSAKSTEGLTIYISQLNKVTGRKLSKILKPGDYVDVTYPSIQATVRYKVSRDGRTAYISKRRIPSELLNSLPTVGKGNEKQYLVGSILIEVKNGK